MPADLIICYRTCLIVPIFSEHNRNQILKSPMPEGQKRSPARHLSLAPEFAVTPVVGPRERPVGFVMLRRLPFSEGMCYPIEKLNFSS